MQILIHGYGLQPKEWHVKEDKAPGYSRVYYIIDGDIHYKDEHCQKKLNKGAIYIFPSTKPYEILHNPENPLVCMWLHIDFFPLVAGEIIEIDGEVSPINSVIEALVCESVSKRIKTQFFEKLHEAFCSYIAESGKLSIYDRDFIKILDMVREDAFKCDFALKNICDKIGYTTEHFIRKFKKNMNTTPYQYVTEMRMNEALLLLLAGDSVTSVSEMVGYKDARIFSRNFKEKYGVSPAKSKFYYKSMA